MKMLDGRNEPAIVHTDQGSVYASVAYNELIKETCIVRSMSRAGKPTDNPVNESLNGWIKEELFIDFELEECKCEEGVIELIDRYVAYYNSQRPCFSIGYDTPDHFMKDMLMVNLRRKTLFQKEFYLKNQNIFTRENRKCLLL